MQEIVAFFGVVVFWLEVAVGIMIQRNKLQNVKEVVFFFLSQFNSENTESWVQSQRRVLVHMG